MAEWQKNALLNSKIFFKPESSKLVSIWHCLKSFFGSKHFLLIIAHLEYKILISTQVRSIAHYGQCVQGGRPPWLHPQVCGREPVSRANLPRRSLTTCSKEQAQGQEVLPVGTHHTPPTIQEIQHSDLKVTALRISQQMGAQKGPRDQLLWFPSLQTRKQEQCHAQAHTVHPLLQDLKLCPTEFKTFFLQPSPLASSLGQLFLFYKNRYTTDQWKW